MSGRVQPFLRRRFLVGTATAGAAAATLTALPPRAGTAPDRSAAIFGGRHRGADRRTRTRRPRLQRHRLRAEGARRQGPFHSSAQFGRHTTAAEHGFRFFPGFYRNVTDTMRRIPFPGNSNGVWQNLTRARSYLHSGLGRADLTVPLPFPIPTLPNPVTPKASSNRSRPCFRRFFGCRSTKPASRPEAGDLRHQQQRTKLGQWEYLTWDDYIGASKRSKEHNRYLADGIIRNLAASKYRRQRTFDRPGWRGLGVVDPAARQRLRQQAFRPRAQRSDECTVARPVGGTSPCPRM
jgi:hypothetical protein